jgi:peptidoglycan/LPS O-acetylase OafA/YrhL
VASRLVGSLSASQSNLSRYIPALDGVRGIAIIWVVLHNAMDRELLPAGPLFHGIELFAHLGWMGVQLFFALSGFLITAGLLDSQGTPHYFRNFYAKRALRILPLYYAVLLVLLVILPRLVTLSSPFSSAHQLPLWLFTTNWTSSVPYGFAHFWSLAVEEQFYLVWPLVVWRFPARRLLNVCVGISLGALLIRAALSAYGVNYSILYGNTACRMDALALGGAGACALRVPEWRTSLQNKSGALGALAVLVVTAGVPMTHLYDRTRWMTETFGYTFLAMSSAVLVSVLALSSVYKINIRAVRLMAWAPLRSCGKYSYGLYVFHGLLHKLWGEPWLVRTFGERPPVQIAFAYGLALLAVCYTLAFASYHGFEQHFLRLKRLCDTP